MYTAGDMIRKINKVKKRFAFAKFCFPKGDDVWFVDQVKKLGKEKNVVTLAKGKGEKQEIFYHIFIPASYSGFFSNFNRVLAYLYFADNYHLTPVVEFSAQNPYAEDHPVNGSSNPFEYYFCQPAGISADEMGKSAVILKSRRENSWLANELDEEAVNYMRSDRFVQEMGRIIRTYIRLKPSVKEEIEKSNQALLKGKKTLGVHVRGTDFKWNYNGHPVCVTAEEYLEEACKLMMENNYEQVFLATDEQNAVEKFSDVFGDKLIYYQDVTRSNGKVTVMKSELERDNHHYLLGLEVLRDALALADCDGLLAGLSQVSYAVRFYKESRGMKFEDMVILNKGINEHTNHNCPV